MKIDEILSQIEAKAGEEVYPKIQSYLKQIAKAYTDLEADHAELEDSYKKVESESIGRKKTIRKLETEVKEKESDIQELKDGKSAEYEKLKADHDKLVAEHGKLETYKAGIEKAEQDQFKQKRETFNGDFGKIAKHKNFEKAKGQFKLPEPNEDGSYDFSKSSDEDMQHNIAKLGEYNELGFFPSGNDNNKTYNKTTQTSTPQGVDWDKVKSPEDLKNVVAGIADQYGQ